MKNMNTIWLLFVVMIFVEGLITLFELQIAATGLVTAYGLLCGSQAIFAAAVMVAALQYTEQYRVVAQLPPMTEEYSPPEVTRLVFLMGIAAFIGSVWLLVRYGDPLAVVVAALMTIAGVVLAVALRFIEREFQRRTQYIFKKKAGDATAKASTTAVQPVKA